MSTVVYRPAEAARVAQCDRSLIDAACASGALVAHDLKPESSRRSWRITAADLDTWIGAGYPRTKADS